MFSKKSLHSESNCDLSIFVATRGGYSNSGPEARIGRNAILFLYNGNIDHLIHVHLTVLNFFFRVLSFWFKFVMHVVSSVVIEYF